MNVNDDYRLLDHTGKTIAMGTKDQMFSYLKHHVPDGRYRIVGSDIKLHCLRKDGNVEPDPDGVCLEARHNDLLGSKMKDYGEMTEAERLDAAAKGLTWCLGMLHELEARQLVDGADAQRLTPKGIAEFDQLTSEGWTPPEDLALTVLKDICGENAEAIWQLIKTLLEEHT